MNVDLDYPKQRLMRYRAISIGLAVFAFCIGGVALLGWILDNPYLKRIHPSLVTMKANTAVCLMLVAVSCFLINDRSPSQFNTVIRRLFAAIVALIGLVTLSEHLFGWNTGLDQLLFHESVQEAGLSFRAAWASPRRSISSFSESRCCFRMPGLDERFACRTSR